jgi:serine/threonine protein kinase/tetratricopeptide (TPR) repeat protein
MSRDELSISDGGDVSGSQDAEVARVLDAYLADLEAGRAADPARLLAEHPAIASQLRDCLEVMHLAERVAEVGGAAPDDQGEAHFGPELGDYRIVRQVGRGGMGIVYEAEQQSLRRRVALKVLPLAAAIDPRQLRRFQVEAQAAAQLHHTNIVPVYAVGCERGVHYYAMQYIEGKSLAELIRELRQLECRDPVDKAPTEVPTNDQDLAGMLASGQLAPAVHDDPPGPIGERVAEGRVRGSSSPAGDPLIRPSGTFSPGGRRGQSSSSDSTHTSAYFRTVANLGIQAAEALEHAHQEGVVHRDIKPANLMVDVKGHLWITDFGLARLQNDSGLTLSGDLVGTIRYMSPEQAIGQRAVVDPRTDLYSLGVTLYEMLTLEPAFDGRDRREVLRRIIEEDPRPLRAINPSVPRELETILQKATAKEPASRYLRAQELADDLRRFLEHRPIRARRPSLPELAAKWARRHAALVGSALVFLVMAVIGFALATLLIWREQAQTRRAYQAEAQLRRRARKAVDEMYGQVAQQLLTQKPDMAKVRREFLERALAYYRDFAVENEADPESRREAAQALRRIANIERQLGHYPESEAAYRQAIPLLEDLADHHPDEPIYRDDLVFCFERLGFALSDTGRLREGESAFRTGLRLAERLAVDFPRQPRYQRRVSELCTNLSTLLYKSGQIQEVEVLLRRARDIKARLVETDLQEARDRGGLVLCNSNLGEVHWEMGRRYEAEQEFRGALRLYQEVSTEDSGNRLDGHTLAAVYMGLGEVLLYFGNLPEAEEAIRSALAIEEKLISDFPNIFWYSALSGRASERLGRILKAAGRWKEAEQALRRGLAIAEKLVDDLPSRADGLPELAHAAAGLGELLWEIGKTAEAREYFRRARDVSERMLAIAPNSAESRLDLSGLLADCPDPRLRDPARAVELARKAVDQSPHLVDAWDALGVALYRAGAAKEAIPPLKRSVEMTSGGGVRTWFFLAMALGKAGETDQARPWWDKATDWMAKKCPKDPGLLRLRAETAALLGLKDTPVIAMPVQPWLPREGVSTTLVFVQPDCNPGENGMSGEFDDPMRRPEAVAMPNEPAPADDDDPVIEAYKKDVDRTLLRENLKLTVEERFAKFGRFWEFAEELREAGRRARQTESGHGA